MLLFSSELLRNKIKGGLGQRSLHLKLVCGCTPLLRLINVSLNRQERASYHEYPQLSQRLRQD